MEGLHIQRKRIHVNTMYRMDFLFLFTSNGFTFINHFLIQICNHFIKTACNCIIYYIKFGISFLSNVLFSKFTNLLGGLRCKYRTLFLYFGDHNVKFIKIFPDLWNCLFVELRICGVVDLWNCLFVEM